ncbi:MAG: acyl-CoA dehydrogenase [Rhodobiaceae bacterium]|nr:acyl-CoA dehydrogenase [Rhodobiaceae bacterium]
MPNIHSEKDLDFILYDMLDTEGLLKTERYGEHSREAFNQILETSARIAEDLFQPHAAKVDANEPEFDGKKVTIIPEVKEALDAYRDAGFPGALFPFEQGGMQLPLTVAQASGFIFGAANVSTAGYAMLTLGAANLISSFGSQAQQDRFLSQMIEGRFFGTMCLSETQAGSSLSDIRTKAVPQEDGTYAITGTKMWISGGEHDMSENIIHMVMAKIEGAPEGAKGISLFIVPKIMVDEEGNLGDLNDVKLAGLNHKMGYRGTVNTFLSFGEEGGAVGYLVGEPNKGLSYMFQMMNEARIGVGLGATSLGYTGYLHSLDYAKGRPQGRLIDAKDPSTPMVPIIEHADIKRLMLQQKSYVEGALHLCLYAARLVDDIATTDDGAEKKDMELLLDLLTPIVKSWPSEFCLEANKIAIQVHGGYGYTREYPVERFYRDNRLNPIHEGTHGIQGLDILGRKVSMAKGRAVELLIERINKTIVSAKADAALSDHAEALEKAVGVLVATTQTLLGAAMQGDVARAFANATLYLDAFGHVVLTWFWLQQALKAQEKLAQGAQGEDASFYVGKLTACTYFVRYELPKAVSSLLELAKLDDTCVSANPDIF